jgi:hypothetical protein
VAEVNLTKNGYRIKTPVSSPATTLPAGPSGTPPVSA